MNESTKQEDCSVKVEGRAACGLHCIKIKDFNVKIGQQTIIEDINLHIHCGRLTAIIGKNGAGKSTLIKSINGEVKHDGSIDFRDKKNDTMEKLAIGYVPQFLNISPNTPTSVYDLIAGCLSKYPIFLRKQKKMYERISEHLKTFEAEQLIDKAVCDLSGGELQRVLLSMAILPVPNLLLLDEPVSGIDKNGMELFYQIIDRFKKTYDLAVILVSHDLDYVKKYADNVILLDRKILIQGNVEEVFGSKEFQSVFG